MIIINKNEEHFINSLLDTLYQLYLIKNRVHDLCSYYLNIDIDNSICNIKFILYDFIHNNIVDKEYCKNHITELDEKMHSEWEYDDDGVVIDDEENDINDSNCNSALFCCFNLIDDYDYQNNRDKDSLNLYDTTKDKEEN